MLLQLALVLICYAMLLHFASRWFVVTRSMRDEQTSKALIDHLDWNRPTDRRRARGKPGLLDQLLR